MRRAEVIYRPEAAADLRQILAAIAELSGSDIVARRYVDRIIARCDKIGDAPQSGRSRDDLSPGLRIVPFERTAVIAYRVTDIVEISNVFYRGRDYETLYRPNDNRA